MNNQRTVLFKNNSVLMAAPFILWIAVLSVSLIWNIQMAEKSKLETIASIGRSFFKEIETARL